MSKRLRCLALSLVTLAGSGAHAVEPPTTQAGYYAVGEQLSQCAAFFTFLSKGFAKEGKQAAAQQLAKQQVSWALASVVYLDMGRAPDAKSADRSIEDTEESKLQARFDANAPTVINDMIADHRRQCEPLEYLREAGVTTLENDSHHAK